MHIIIKVQRTCSDKEPEAPLIYNTFTERLWKKISIHLNLKHYKDNIFT